MMEETNASADADAMEEPRPALPDGDYAIVEMLGHRKLVGRIAEVERFGTKLCAVEPIFAGALLPAVMIGGGSIYQLTPCSAAAALARAPKQAWQLASSVTAILPMTALPAPRDDSDDEDEPSFFAPAFLSNGDDGQ